MNTRILSDDFIDEAQARFARATTKELARYIEAATIDAMVGRRQHPLMFRAGVGANIRVDGDPTVPPNTIVVEQDGREVVRITNVGA